MKFNELFKNKPIGTLGAIALLAALSACSGSDSKKKVTTPQSCLGVSSDSLLQGSYELDGVTTKLSIAYYKAVDSDVAWSFTEMNGEEIVSSESSYLDQEGQSLSTNWDLSEVSTMEAAEDASEEEVAAAQAAISAHIAEKGNLIFEKNEADAGESQACDETTVESCVEKIQAAIDRIEIAKKNFESSVGGSTDKQVALRFACAQAKLQRAIDSLLNPADEVVEVPSEEPAAETPSEEPAVEETPSEEPAVEETPSEEPVAEETPSEEPAAEETPSEEPAAEETPSEEPVAEETPSEEPATEETPSEEPAA